MKMLIEVTTPPDANPGEVKINGTVVAKVNDQGVVESASNLAIPQPSGGLPSVAPSPPPPQGPVGSIEAAAVAMASQTRHGHLYNGRHQQRIGILEADDLRFRYSPQEALGKDIVARNYDGTVRLILPDRSIRTLQTSAQLYPVDYYLWDVDGSAVRCNQYGQISYELENMTPAPVGAVAGGKNDTGGDDTVHIEQG